MTSKQLKRLPWWKRNVNDWRGGTRGMSMELRGFYGEFLDAQWDEQGPLPKDERRLGMMLGCSPRTVRKLLPELISLGKIRETDLGYENPRMASDIQSKFGSDSIETGGEFASNSGAIRAENLKNANEVKGRAEKSSRERARAQASDSRDSPTSVHGSDSDGRTGLALELKGHFNGSTEAMLSLATVALGGSRPHAERWLASTVSAYGAPAVSKAYAGIVEKQARGEVVVNITGLWSRMAGSAKAQAPSPGAGAAPASRAAVAADLLGRLRQGDRATS